VRVHLHQERAADQHRLALGVIHVVGQDGAPARDLGAYELGLDALAQRGELHLGSHDAAPRVVELSHGAPVARAQRPRALAGELGRPRAAPAVVLGPRRPAGVFLHVAALADPAVAQLGQTGEEVDVLRRVTVRAGRVVQAHPGIRDVADRYAQIGPRADDVGTPRSWEVPVLAHVRRLL